MRDEGGDWRSGGGWRVARWVGMMLQIPPCSRHLTLQ